MTASSSENRWEAELRMLRQELSELRSEQREMAQAIQQLVTTFRTLAAGLGLAAEPYARKDRQGSERELPGFG